MSEMCTIQIYVQLWFTLILLILAMFATISTADKHILILAMHSIKVI